MKPILAALLLLCSVFASAQNTTIYSGNITDLAGTLVTSGQVTFELRPGADSTISGIARVVPSTITCSINQATAATNSAVRAANSVTISGLTGHTFVANDVITVSGMADATFNGTFTVGSITATSITYPQTAAGATSGGGIISALRATPGPGSCTLTRNTVLTPTNTSYRVCIQPGFISPGSCFNDYAVTATKDISTPVPTPTTSPAYTFVDLHSAQTIDGNKTFTGSTAFAQTSIVANDGTFKNINKTRHVDSVNSQGWTGADLGAWINAAAADAGVEGVVAVDPAPNGIFPSITTPLVLPRGLLLLLPPGAFNIVSGTVISNDGVNILGSGMATTSLVPTSATGDIFKFTGASFAIGNMTVNPSVTRTSGAFINVQTTQGIVHDITLQDMFDGFVQGAGAGTTVFSNIIAVGAGGNWHNVFRNGPLTTGTIPGTFISNFVIGLSGTGSTISGDLFLLDSGTDSTKINGLEISRTTGADTNVGIRLQKSAAAQAPSFVTMVNSYCETTSTNVCVQIDSANNFSSETFGFALGLLGLKITGGRGITFANGFISLAQQGAVSITGGIGINILGIKISDDAVAAANTYDAISVAAGVTDFSIVGNTIGNIVFSGNTFRNGITVAAGASDKYVITGNIIDGVGTSKISDGGTGVNKTVEAMGGGYTGYGSGDGLSSSLVAEGAGGNASTFGMFNASAGVDSKWWEMISLSGTGTLIFRTLNDALNVQVPWLTVTRSGQSPLLATFAVPVNATTFQTATNCAVNSVSPAACGSAAGGAFVIPTTTTTYTVNTSAVTANSLIFLQPRTYTGNLPGTPTCVAPATGVEPVVSAISAGVSFSVAIVSTTGQTCWNYHIVN